MPQVSAVVIAQDESDRIERAVKSVLPWVDEVVVLDGGSEDDTCVRARAAGARVLERPFDGFVTQKREATQAAHNDLVFSLDADEVVDEELGRALREVAQTEVQLSAVAWWVRRKNYLDGRPLAASGWYPDKRLRLFDRRCARWGGYEPHDRVEAAGALAELPGHIHHDPDRTTEDYIAATVRHSERRAESLVAAGGRPGLLAAESHALWHFVKKLVFCRAWLDGRAGLQVAWVGARGVHRKYRRARELAR